MKEICILGQNGVIGKTVTEILKKRYVVKSSGFCDVLVNCAGFAIMHEAAKNPDKMREVESYTFKRITSIQFERLIHISSIYIEASPNDNYSIIKKEMEDRILASYPNSTILRCTSVLGKGLKKNVIFDLKHDRPLWVTSDAVYNYISAEEVALIIEHLIENPRFEIINVGASASVCVADLVFALGKKTTYGTKKDHVVMDVSKLQSFYKVKTSMDYVRDFWNVYAKEEK